MADHHARHVRLDRRPVRREVGLAHVPAHVRPLVGRERAATRARGSASRTRRRRRPRGRGRTRRRRTASGTGASRAARRAGRAPGRGRRPRRRARSATPVARPGREGLAPCSAPRGPTTAAAAAGTSCTSPPSWSTNDERAGRPRLRRGPSACTITPPTPGGAGRPETTTSAAFCCGVSPSTAAWRGAAATPKASVD